MLLELFIACNIRYVFLSFDSIKTIIIIIIIIIRNYSHYEDGSTGLFRENTIQVSAFATSALTNISGKGYHRMFYIKMKLKFVLIYFYSCYGKVMTQLLFLFAFLILCTRSFCRKSHKRACTSLLQSLNNFYISIWNYKITKIVRAL